MHKLFSYNSLKKTFSERLIKVARHKKIMQSLKCIAKYLSVENMKAVKNRIWFGKMAHTTGFSCVIPTQEKPADLSVFEASLLYITIT